MKGECACSERDTRMHTMSSHFDTTRGRWRQKKMEKDRTDAARRNKITKEISKQLRIKRKSQDSEGRR